MSSPRHTQGISQVCVYVYEYTPSHFIHIHTLPLSLYAYAYTPSATLYTYIHSLSHCALINTLPLSLCPSFRPYATLAFFVVHPVFRTNAPLGFSSRRFRVFLCFSHPGGRAGSSVKHELVYRFEFPERPGALARFLNKLKMGCPHRPPHPIPAHPLPTPSPPTSSTNSRWGGTFPYPPLVPPILPPPLSPP